MVTSNENGASSVQDPTQGAAATDATAAPVADVKGKGKAAATEEAHDTSMATDEDDEEEDEAEEVRLLRSNFVVWLARRYTNDCVC